MDLRRSARLTTKSKKRKCICCDDDDSTMSVVPTTTTREEHSPSVHAAAADDKVVNISVSKSSQQSISSARSNLSQVSVAAHRRLLEARAARERAELDKVLIDAKLQEEIALLSVNNDAESTRSNRIKQWVENIEANDSIFADDGPKVHHYKRPDCQDVNTTMDKLTRAITDAVKTKSNVGTTVGTDKLLGRLSARDLPSFTGDPLEWLRFKSAFERTTQVGQYSDQENLSRLQRCLHGEAWEAVAARLIATTTSANDVMKTLEMRFGRPDLILTKLIAEIKKVPKLSGARSEVVVLATKVDNCVAAIEYAGTTGYLYSPELNAEIISKLTETIFYRWMDFSRDLSLHQPQLPTLAKFLMREAQDICKRGAVEPLKTSRPGPSFSKRPLLLTSAEEKDTQDYSINVVSDQRERKCVFCDNLDHTINSCSRFKSEDVDQRWEWICKRRLCFKCLKSTHRRDRCKSKTRCLTCKGGHHTLLHRDDWNNWSKKESEVKKEITETTANVWAESDKKVFLKVLPIIVEGPEGCINTYALLDEGSTVTLVESQIAEKIGATGPKDGLNLQGAIGRGNNMISQIVTLTIRTSETTYKLNRVRTVKDLTLPRRSVTERDISQYEHLQGIPIHTFVGRPTILIGQDNWQLIISREIIEDRDKDDGTGPCVQERNHRKPRTEKYIAATMPHTQEKQFECNITNNNDHNYLHKKFKKMASTIPPSTLNYTKENEISYKDLEGLDVPQAATNSSISNGSIAAAHPEIEKIKELWLDSLLSEKDVQINFRDNHRLSELNINNSGQTSNSEEFSSKTDNAENDFTKDVQNVGPGGRYACPYCKISCAKPSVLLKHIRAHTNERPYPCVPCGFAFKTKSNLYKHRRSRTHALRLQGTDVSASTQDDDWSADSESDTSLPPTAMYETGSDMLNARLDNNRPNEFSSPEIANDRTTPPSHLTSDANKIKSIYKPKFRAALYQEHDDKQKKSFSPNADFLNEHISKIISDNEAIVDVIETPLQKKYGKIKQIAESKQLLYDNFDIKSEVTPLNLTKSSGDNDIVFRKRSHSESFSQNNQKHPLNPEGSIIKDLLLKTKASNGLTPVPAEIVDVLGPLYICPICRVTFRNTDNMEIHRTYYCKGHTSNIQLIYPTKDAKAPKPDNVFVRSNSITSRLPETPPLLNLSTSTPSPPLRNHKPDNLVIIKPENHEIIAPLPSPGPLLGNTRLVDTRLPSDYSRKSEHYKIKSMQSPKRRLDRSDNYSPRLESASPRSMDLYPQAKMRCLEQNAVVLRTLDDFSNNRHNTTSLQMFGGEVKIVDYSGGTTTLRIEPSKSQLSPILIHQSMSPSKHGGEIEASNVVVRSGLHSGGTIVHNPPTPKEKIATPQSQMSRISSASSLHPNLPNLHETHFQFPPLSAITAFNPLTLPPLSPTLSPNGASTILHGGKLIPHVPGMPGPNTSALYIGNSRNEMKKNANFEVSKSNAEMFKDVLVKSHLQGNNSTVSSKFEGTWNSTLKLVHQDVERNIPLIKVKNVDEPISSTTKTSPTNVKSGYTILKRNVDYSLRTQVTRDNVFRSNSPKPDKLNADKKTDEVQDYNFENLITKAEIYNNQVTNPTEVQKNSNDHDASNLSIHNERSETLYFQKNSTDKSVSEDRKTKFLRPTTLPLKPGTFTPKRHHGITPNANTMPLVSPETPRPSKAYGQLYLNGNAYTYLGLKCSTKVFYCTINRPQPTYVPNQHFLSMYSNWQLLSELIPDPLGLTASSAMSLYDSRHRPQSTTIAVMKHDLILTHSSQWKRSFKDNKQVTSSDRKADEGKGHLDNTITPKKELTGGFESNEEYTYVRGRGRGRYVCLECGIRCKKPSMLKKHIRTHTDVRPYTCTHCAFSFKTKGNLTKHMKSKAHYKKCCELGINPNEGNDADSGENAQGSGETDEDSESDGEDGNEGETESSDTETCKSRLPEHEAAHCLLSLGSPRPATTTPGLITSARPTTYPYTPTGLDGDPSECNQDKTILIQNQSSDQTKMDVCNEPMDLSKTDVKCTSTITEIPTEGESSVLASLASNTAKLPQHQNQWSNGEPMLHAYLTERALLDSKIKQSQLTSSLSKRKIEPEKAVFQDKSNIINGSLSNQTLTNTTVVTMANNVIVSSVSKDIPKVENTHLKIPISKETTKSTVNNSSSNIEIEPKIRTTQHDNSASTENAKFVVSEYLKHAKVAAIIENSQNQKDGEIYEYITGNMEECGKADDGNNSDTDSVKMPMKDHDLVAQKVVIGAGGVAFKVSSKGKEFESTPTVYALGKLMEDGRRVCDFCNKTFTKPSQLRLHLNIHYMERPFRCGACAVSFRTRGHLQKHERSGSHHNKVSMTSTFGAATSLNPRPFRCSDCNIAFRIHGHLAKHLRSKMHVMRLECLFKLPFGTFTEIERAGVSLTDIDTTDCASSLASLQVLAQKLHENDPTKLEYRDPNTVTSVTAVGRESSEDEECVFSTEKSSESDRDIEMRTTANCENLANDTRIIYSATDN